MVSIMNNLHIHNLVKTIYLGPFDLWGERELFHLKIEIFKTNDKPGNYLAKAYHLEYIFSSKQLKKSSTLLLSDYNNIWVRSSFSLPEHTVCSRMNDTITKILKHTEKYYNVKIVDFF